MQRLWIMVATHFIYDTFNRVWGMFPRHGEAPLYFLAHVYAKFVLHIDHNYMSTPSWFDGPNRGHSYEYPETHRDYLRTRRDPTTIPTSPRLVLLPRRSIVLP